MSSLQRRLEKLDTQENKADEYSKVLNEVFETESTANLTAFVDHLVKQNPISVRGVYKTLVDLVRKRRADRNASSLLPWLEASIVTISATGQQVLEETINLLRFNAAKIYQHEMTDDPENFVKAVRHYAKMNLDNATTQLKVKAWVRAAQLCVADKLFTQAEQFTTKLGNFIKLGSNRAKIDEKYRKRYLSANASIQDFNTKFHVAASEYYRLSTLLSESECVDKLKAGLRCVLLAPGSSVLGQYYKDDRCATLPGFNLAEKMFLGRFIDSNECEEFEKTLEEHQQRKTKEGWSLLKKAVIEHNLIAASHVYTNISMHNLGQVLGVSKEEAEQISSRMITGSRLKGTIDQQKGTLQFTSVDFSELTVWDTHVGIACTAVNDIFDRLTVLYPEWVEKQYV